MTTRTLGDKGQVVIPKKIRDFFNLRPGVDLEFDIKDGRIIITPVDSDSFLSDFCSIVRDKLHEPVRFKDIFEKEVEERMHDDLS